jgi:hypothetical protein
LSAATRCHDMPNDRVGGAPLAAHLSRIDQI